MTRLAMLLLLALGSGCGGYIGQTASVRKAYEAGDYPTALSKLDAQDKSVAQIDRLLYLLDKGTVLHAAGRWEDSRKVLAEADDLSEKLNLTSVTEEAASVFANENVRSYRGEDFERLMISVLQALNYYELGDREGALVEARRCNEKLEKMQSKSKKPFEQLAIARYLSAVIREEMGDRDGAAIDYFKAAEVSPQLGSAAGAVQRLLKETKRDDDYQLVKKRWPDADEAGPHKGQGEVVVVVESGKVPTKGTNMRNQTGLQANLIAVPTYTPRARTVSNASVRVGETAVTAGVVTDVDSVARADLEDRVGKTIARSVGGLAVKAGAAAALGAATKSEAVGVAAFALLSLTQQADTRSWLSLPAEFQVGRVAANAGPTKVLVSAQGRQLSVDAEVKAGHITVVVVRVF